MTKLNDRIERRKGRVRGALLQAAHGRKRLSVFRSSKHIYAQVIDDAAGKTLASASSIEKPTRYRLFVGWETLENHTVDFRGSADFQEWRKLVGHCFAAPPDVEHVSQVTRGF